MLLHFLSELLRNPQSQGVFSRDPEHAMSSANLSHAAKTALRSRDRNAVAAALVAELDTLDTSQILYWPAPKVLVSTVEPKSGKRGQTVKLTVTGQWFDTTATCQLVLGDTKIDGKVLSVSGEENTVLEASFALSATARLGAYGVTVANDPQNSDTLPNAFTISD